MRSASVASGVLHLPVIGLVLCDPGLPRIAVLNPHNGPVLGGD